MTVPHAMFPFFMVLPFEIRHEIWLAAWLTTESPRPDRGVCIFDREEAFRPVVHEPRNLALLAACRESRFAAIKYGSERDYDPKHDILYIATLTRESVERSLAGPLISSLISEIAHVAVGLRWTLEPLWLLLQPIDALKSVSIVLPKKSGALDCEADVEVPRRDAPLRLLTQDKIGGLTLDTAQAWPWFRRYFNEEIPLEKHLRVKRDEYILHLVGASRHAPSIWDYYLEELYPRIEARYFDESRLSSF